GHDRIFLAVSGPDPGLDEQVFAGKAPDGDGGDAFLRKSVRMPGGAFDFGDAGEIAPGPRGEVAGNGFFAAIVARLVGVGSEGAVGLQRRTELAGGGGRLEDGIESGDGTEVAGAAEG